MERQQKGGGARPPDLGDPVQKRKMPDSKEPVQERQMQQDPRREGSGAPDQRKQQKEQQKEKQKKTQEEKQGAAQGEGWQQGPAEMERRGPR